LSRRNNLSGTSKNSDSANLCEPELWQQDSRVETMGNSDFLMRMFPPSLVFEGRVTARAAFISCHGLSSGLAQPKVLMVNQYRVGST
jgi:hypothetical protein